MLRSSRDVLTLCLDERVDSGEDLPVASVIKGGVWVDMGGGTGSNLEFFGDKLNHWGKVVVLDLCPSLVETAQKRVTARGWDSFVSVVLGDACDFDCVGMPAAGTLSITEHRP